MDGVTRPKLSYNFLKETIKKVGNTQRSNADEIWFLFDRFPRQIMVVADVHHATRK